MKRAFGSRSHAPFWLVLVAMSASGPQRCLFDVMRVETGSSTRRHSRTNAVLRLLKPFVLREWRDQPAVVRRPSLPRGGRMAFNGLGLLAKGDLSAIMGKVAHQRALPDGGRTTEAVAGDIMAGRMFFTIVAILFIVTVALFILRPLSG